MTLGYFTLNPIAEEFVRTAYEDGWVELGFDWPSWSRSPEALALREDPGRIAQATPEQLAHLLTRLIRSDRNSDGELLTEAYDAGRLTEIIRRASALAEPEVDDR